MVIERAASVVSVSSDAEHNFTKPRCDEITLVEGLGVEGDAHFGSTVQHLSRKARDPDSPNLRQVHLIHRELFDEVAADGFTVEPGELGENVTTDGLDLLELPQGTRLTLGEKAVIEITGLRNPCRQINGLQAGLMKELVTTDATGRVIRKSGVMAVVLNGGVVRPGDAIAVELPDGEHKPLEVV